MKISNVHLQYYVKFHYFCKNKNCKNKNSCRDDPHARLPTMGEQTLVGAGKFEQLFYTDNFNDNRTDKVSD